MMFIFYSQKVHRTAKNLKSPEPMTRTPKTRKTPPAGADGAVVKRYNGQTMSIYTGVRNRRRNSASFSLWARAHMVLAYTLSPVMS